MPNSDLRANLKVHLLLFPETNAAEAFAVSLTVPRVSMGISKFKFRFLQGLKAKLVIEIDIKTAAGRL